jgi:molecular chaperone IbpA
LKIAGKTSDDNDNFLHKGIANRAFSRTFNLADTIEVKDASLVNGMLKVFLENIIPDHKKPRKVSINTAKEETKEAEDFLSGAKDHAELERRQKLIANGYTQHYSIYTRKGYI